MDFSPTAIPDVLLVRPKVFQDDRGFFVETYRADAFAAAGVHAAFVQDNHSGSHRGALRGLHYQVQHTQGKLVRVVAGEVFDVMAIGLPVVSWPYIPAADMPMPCWPRDIFSR